MSYTNIPGPGSQFKESVATASALPTVGNQTGDVRTVRDTGEIYFWDGSTWQAGGGSGPVEGTDILSTGEPANRVLTSNGSGGSAWAGDVTAVVVGPASATDNALTRFDGTTGKLVQNSLVIVNDQGSVSLQRVTFITQNVFLSSSSGAAITTGTQNVLIGGSSGSLLTTQSNNVFIGHQTGNEATSVEESVVIGSQANSGTSAQRAVVIGRSAGSNAMTGTQNVIIGYNSGTAVTSGTLNVIIGALAGTTLTTGSSNILLGNDAEPSANNAVNEMVIGSEVSPITRVFIGEGVISTTPQNISIHATGGSGTNISGSTLFLIGGQGTGSGTGGDVRFMTSPSGTSGTSPNASIDRGGISGEGRWSVGGSGNLNDHIINGNGLVLTTSSLGADFNIVKSEDTGLLRLLGGSGIASAGLVLYGSGHGGSPQLVEFTNNLGQTLLIDANGKLYMGPVGNAQTHELRGNELSLIRPSNGEDFIIRRNEDSGALGLIGGTSLGSGFLYLYGATSGQSGRVQLGSDNLPYIDIDGNGLVTIGVGNSQTHAINGAEEAADANVLTLTNGPVGTSGNPGIYLRLTVNGVTYVFPGWQLP